METTITMTANEQHRAGVLTRILKGDLSMSEGALRLDLSIRQLWRLRVAYLRDGPAGLVHGNRGQPSARRIGAEIRARVLELRQTTYADVNDSHFTELLEIGSAS